MTNLTPVPIPDLPDLGTFTSGSSIVGRRTGNGRFMAGAVRDFVTPVIAAHNFITADMTDHALAIQAAIDLAYSRGGGTVVCRPQYWNLASTIQGRNGVRVEGATKADVIWYRTGSYGDTFVQVGGTCTLTDIWLWHGPDGNGGQTAPLENRLTDGSAHLRFVNCQEVNLERVRAFRMPYGIVFDGTVHARVRDCWTFGFWNEEDEAQQEGIADISFLGTTSQCVLAVIDGCYLSGSVGVLAPFTFTSTGGGSATSTVYRNVGRQTGIDVHSCEGLSITSTYIGRASRCLVNLEPRGPHAFIADVQIGNCFFDDVGVPWYGAQLRVAGSPTAYVLGLAVSNCTFNGELDAIHGIYAPPPSVGDGVYPNVASMAVTGCTFFAHVATPIRLHAVRGGLIGSNTITNYNCLGTAAPGGDLTFASGVFVGNQSVAVHVCNNLIGGGGNSFQPSVLNSCHYGVTIDASVAATCSQSGNVNAGITTSFASQQIVQTMEPTVDILHDLGAPTKRVANVYAAQLRPGDGTAIWSTAFGSPEGVLAAVVGSIYVRKDGSPGSRLYFKATGSGNTGWAAIL